MKLRYLVFVFKYETLVGERTKAPPKYIDGALSRGLGDVYKRQLMNCVFPYGNSISFLLI